MYVCVCVYVGVVGGGTDSFSSLIESLITKKADYKNTASSMEPMDSSKCERYSSLT